MEAIKELMEQVEKTIVKETLCTVRRNLAKAILDGKDLKSITDLCEVINDTADEFEVTL